jgi:CMP-2-keto-3-deoxyoctulosonic acid synthetase
LGIYGYSKQRLLAYANSKPDTYEELEGLEQLRWLSLQLGTKIAVRKVEFDGIEINTPEDAEKWNKIHA